MSTSTAKPNIMADLGKSSARTLHMILPGPESYAATHIRVHKVKKKQSALWYIKQTLTGEDPNLLPFTCNTANIIMISALVRNTRPTLDATDVGVPAVSDAVVSASLAFRLGPLQ
jgi:hypothetical protein